MALTLSAALDLGWRELLLTLGGEGEPSMWYEPGPASVICEACWKRLVRDLNWCPPSSLTFTIMIFLFSYLVMEGLMIGEETLYCPGPSPV
jgi:hypothetical protein